MDQYLVIVSWRPSTTRQTVVQAASSGSSTPGGSGRVADVEELTGLRGMAAVELATGGEEREQRLPLALARRSRQGLPVEPLDPLRVRTRRRRQERPGPAPAPPRRTSGR